MKKYVIAFCILFVIFLCLSFTFSTQSIMVGNNSKALINITKHPRVYDMKNEKINEFPNFNPKTIEDYEIDLLGKDLSDIDLRSKSNELMYAKFNSYTKWPLKLPSEFEPNFILENGKNPGLNIRSLHSEGIRGKGIGIAIIDQPLLVDHIEYKDSLKLYEEIGVFDNVADYHGGLVSSIAVGKSVGVAPDADLYYIAARNMDEDGQINFKNVAEAIHRILDLNRNLNKKNKIRVISISNGWIKGQRGYDEIMKAIERAKEEEVFVVSSMIVGDYGYFFDGLGREPMKNPDDAGSFEPSILYRAYYYSENNIYRFFEGRVLTRFKLNRKIEEILYVPIDSRTFASPFAIDDYIFERRGGWSSCSPYIAGLYALACEVYPKLTPEVFWKTALETGDKITINKDDKKLVIEKIVNPMKLMEELYN